MDVPPAEGERAALRGDEAGRARRSGGFGSGGAVEPGFGTPWPARSWTKVTFVRSGRTKAALVRAGYRHRSRRAAPAPAEARFRPGMCGSVGPAGLHGRAGVVAVHRASTTWLAGW